MKTKRVLNEDLIKGINWQPLEKAVTKAIDTPITLKVTVSERRRFNDEIVFRLNIESENIVEEAGMFRVCLKELQVTNFGGNITDDGEGLWIPIHFSFSFKDGGSNGMTILWALYKFATKRWSFKLVGDRT